MSVLPQFHGFFVGGNEFAFREGFKRQKDHDFEGDVSGGTVANTLGTPTESRIRASATWQDGGIFRLPGGADR